MAQLLCPKDELVEKIYAKNYSPEFTVLQKHRSSRPKVFYKIGIKVLGVKNFAKFTEKHIYRSPEACNLIKKRLQ